MIRLEKKLVLVLTFSAAIIIIISVFLAVGFQKALDEPATCAMCHEMDKYVSTYLQPENGSIIVEHGMGCFGCHANTTAMRAKNAVMKQIGIGVINMFVGSDFSTTRHDLAVNCTKCHFMTGYSHLDFNSTAECIKCHWAHSLSQASFNPYAIPSGPHKNQTCINCHGKDYNIPGCTNCHKGHGEQKLTNSLCLDCHIDPHVPKKPGVLPGTTVNFSKDMPFSLCTPCHEKQYDELMNSRSKHLDMQTCTLCHDRHGKKPRCVQCHPDRKVHGHLTLVCNDCHGKIRPLYCALCHGKSHEWSAQTALHPD